MKIADKAVYAFNKFYGSFLRDVKGSSALKDKVKENYKVIVKTSPDYMTFFWAEFGKYSSGGKINASNKDLIDCNVFKGIKLSDIISQLGVENTVTIWNYVYILSALSMFCGSLPAQVQSEGDANEADDGAEDGGDDDAPSLVDANNEEDVLFHKILRVFSLGQSGEDNTSDLADILDDDLRGVLSLVTKAEAPSTSATPDEFSSMFGAIENSKICGLAKEISKEIDVSNVKLEKPEDVMKLFDFSNGNNILGNIIGKVSNKIQEKMSNGELKQEDLLGEAMSMMSMINKNGGMASELLNNPMMAEMMKGMKKGKVHTRPDAFKKESARDRLRKKLDARQGTKE